MISQSVSGASSPIDSPLSNGIDEALSLQDEVPSLPSPVFPSSPLASTPTSPNSPSTPSSGIFRRGHARQQSLGTTKTSPSTRRRSIESTISLIKEVVDSTGPPPLSSMDDEVESPLGSPMKSPVNGSGTNARVQDPLPPPPPPFSVPNVPPTDPEDTVPSWG